MLTIFGVPVSQPVRAVVWPCLIKKCPFTFVPVTPGKEGKKGTRNPEYLAMNPSGQIPAINDDGFKLGESMAILSYLAETRRWSDLWPSDPQASPCVPHFSVVYGWPGPPLLFLDILCNEITWNLFSVYHRNGRE